MTSQKDLIAYYEGELRRSKKWRHENYDDDWRRYVDLYRGRHYDTTSDTDQLIVNLCFATINVLAPAIAVRNPRFTVHARKPEAGPQAVVAEELLNYTWYQHKLQTQFRLGVLDSLILGHGWLKIGWKAVKKAEVKKVDETADGAEGEGIDDRDDVEGNMESEMHVSDDRPFLERISPFDVYVDPDARHPTEMRWIAQRTWRPVNDVRADSRYSATVRKRVTGRAWSRWQDEDSDARDDSERADTGKAKYAEIIEFYDLRRNTMSVFACGTDNTQGDAEGFLIRPTDIPYECGHPLVMIRNHEVPDHFYTIGDLEQIESLQLELNETRTDMLNHRKRFARKWLYRKSAFDRDGIAALESDIDNTMVPVLDDDNPGSAVAPMPAVITPPEFYNQSQLITDDMNEVSGVSDYQRGSPQSNIKRTATEAAMIADAANARVADRLYRIEDVLAQCGERIIKLMQQYSTGENYARMMSVPGQVWFPYKSKYIQGDFDYVVVGGSTEPQNETFRRQSAMQLVDASMPFLQNGVADPVPLFRKVLQGFGIVDTTEYIMAPGMQPEPTPQPPAEQAPPGAPPPPMPGGAPMPGMPPGMPPGMQGMPPEMMAAMAGGGSEMGMPPDIPPELLQALLDLSAEMNGGVAPI